MKLNEHQKQFCFFATRNWKIKSERKWSWKNTKNNFTSLQLEIENLKMKENEVERTPKEFYFFATGNKKPKTKRKWS